MASMVARVGMRGGRSGRGGGFLGSGWLGVGGLGGKLRPGGGRVPAKGDFRGFVDLKVLHTTPPAATRMASSGPVQGFYIHYVLSKRNVLFLLILKISFLCFDICRVLYSFGGSQFPALSQT